MRILVTGGAGYIGTHTCVELLQQDHDVTIVDTFRTSRREVLHRIATICGRSPTLIEIDIRDTVALQQALRDSRAQAVIHFAALKAVGESQSIPLEYFDNNIGGTISLLQAMRSSGVRHLVFSSSATVYGNAEHQPVREDFPLGASNPYGRTKLVCEQMIGDAAAADDRLVPAILRYFNPVGAHVSGLIGEYPLGVPNNLLPYVAQTAAGLHPHVRVFGNDYPTHDGTGVRDYIHVTDLAMAHLRALDYLVQRDTALTVNVGTGRGYSVLEAIDTFRRVTQRPIPVRIYPRRPGDIATCFASPDLAADLLGWRAKADLEQMCEDAWRWQCTLQDA